MSLAIDNMFCIMRVVNDSNEPMTPHQISEKTFLNKRTVQRHAMRLATEGLIELKSRSHGFFIYEKRIKSMSDYVNCPNCQHKISTENFADEGMHDFKTWEEECPECEQVFEITAMIEVCYRILTRNKNNEPNPRLISLRP